MLIYDESHALIDWNETQGRPLFNEVLRSQFTEARVELKASGLKAELHVAQLIVGGVKGVNSTHVTRQGEQRVTSQWAELLGMVLDVVRCEVV